MELRVLRYFLMVAREENITRAASLLHVTQPTLSRQLMQLEDELNTKLFIRGSHHITLTEAGMLLKRRAQEMIFLEKKIQEEFLDDMNELSGEIVIGCGETNAVNFVSQVISTFTKEHPLVHFAIDTGNTDLIKENIDKGLYDFGILLEPVDITKYDFIRIPENEYWGILVREDSELAQKDGIKPQDLRQYPLMIPNRAMALNEVTNWFGEEYQKMNIIVHYNLGYNLSYLIKNEIGVAVCLDVANQMRDLKFVPFQPALITHSIVVWKKEQSFSPAVKTFLEFIRKRI